MHRDLETLKIGDSAAGSGASGFCSNTRDSAIGIVNANAVKTLYLLQMVY